MNQDRCWHDFLPLLLKENQEMEWYKLNISREDAVKNGADELFISLVRNYHSLSVSLGSVVLYRTPLDENGTSFFLHCADEGVLKKLVRNFKLEKAPQPKLEELEPVYGEFLGEDVAEVLGMEITGERAPSSAPPYAEPYRGGDAGYGFKERRREQSTHPAQQRRSDEGRAAAS